MMTKSLLDAAMNAATLARSPVGEPAIGPSVGLSAEDVKRARDILATMPEDPLTTAFDRRDYLIANDWRPAQATNNQQSRERELIGHVLPIIDSGWGLVHGKGAAESVFRKERELLDSISGEDLERRIPALEGILARLVEAGWPHVNSPFVSNNAKKVFLKARDFVSSLAAAKFDELFAEVVEELRESHSDLEDSEIVASIKENVRDDFQATGDALQDHLQLCGAVEKEIERAEFTDKLRM